MAEGEIAPGLKGEKSTIVCEHNVAGHVGKFSTPSMILLMEQASMVALEGRVPSGQTSVGYEVQVRHLAPSSLGATVTARAELLEVDRNRLTFKVEAFDGERKVGEGTHRRALVPVADSR